MPNKGGVIACKPKMAVYMPINRMGGKKKNGTIKWLNIFLTKCVVLLKRKQLKIHTENTSLNRKVSVKN
jgi:hypothetical protein